MHLSRRYGRANKLRIDNYLQLSLNALAGSTGTVSSSHRCACALHLKEGEARHGAHAHMMRAHVGFWMRKLSRLTPLTPPWTCGGAVAVGRRCESLDVAGRGGMAAVRGDHMMVPCL